MKRFRLSEGIDSMGANQLSKLYNVDIHAVLKWIRKGWLKAERTGTTGDNHDRYHITTENVRAFIYEHPELIELSKLERAGSKMWLLELVSAGRISEGLDGPVGKIVVASIPMPGAAPVPAPDRTVVLYGERLTLAALAEISGRPAAELLHRIDGLGLSVNDAAFGDESAAPVGPPAPAAVTLSIVAQILALMKGHRAKPEQLAGWTELPLEVVERVLRGEAALVLPAMMTMVQTLNADLTVSVTLRK